MGEIIIFGASRGLGAALAQGVPMPGEKAWLVSRSKPAVLDSQDGIDREWLQHDLADTGSMSALANQVRDRPIDLLIYNAGIWEKSSFEAAGDDEIRAIVDTNLTSLLLCIRHLLPALRRSSDARVVLIGSTCGLENEGTTSIAYAATKFAMRGVAHALRELVRPDGIAVTVISPGSMATDVSLDEGSQSALRRHDSARIPVSDIVEIVRLLRRLSPATCVKELHVPALRDTDV